MKDLETALQTKLAADTGAGGLMTFVTGVYNLVAPASTTYPYLVFQKVVGTPGYTLGQRIGTGYLYQFRIIGEGGSKATILDALARLDSLLTDQVLTVGGTAAWYVRRDGDMPDVAEMDGGVLFLQVGATYRIELGG